MDGDTKATPIEQALLRHATDKAVDGMVLSDDYVARRIVMRRDLWEELVKLAEALKETRGITVSPTDVAAIALEAGMAKVKP